MNQTEERLTLFQELLSCVSRLYIWKYDDNLNLISSNCPEESILHTMLLLEKHSDYILEHAASSHMPLIFSNSLDMNWTAFYEYEQEKLLHIYLLGPVFTEANAIPQKESALKKLMLSPQSMHQFMKLLETLPILGISQYLQVAIMMHYCITKEKISLSDFQYHKLQHRNSDSDIYSKTGTERSYPNRHSSYLFEQRLMKFVEEGNIGYLSDSSKLSYSGYTGKMSNNDSIRQMKNTINIAIALFMRAAIRGGLSIETAYILSDHYIQDVERCKNTSEIIQVNQKMQRDFIQRVHNHRIKSSKSAFLKMCCDYVDLHIEDDFSICDLAKYVGYTEHYVGKKFKAEMKISLKQYINQKRIEYAKLLLQSTTLSISDIGERLHFCSTSYFIKIFREFTSITPAEYRG